PRRLDRQHQPHAAALGQGGAWSCGRRPPTTSSLLPGTWHVLIDEDGVSIRIHQAKVRRARGRLVGLDDQGKALTLERLLDVPNGVEIRQRVAGAVPAGVERQGVLLEHPLEKPDGTCLILKDQPVARGVTADGAEAELLVYRRAVFSYNRK